jgi:hypothetical protein
MRIYDWDLATINQKLSDRELNPSDNRFGRGEPNSVCVILGSHSAGIASQIEMFRPQFVEYRLPIIGTVAPSFRRRWTAPRPGSILLTK